jgi:hypothetical protein
VEAESALAARQPFCSRIQELAQAGASGDGAGRRKPWPHVRRLSLVEAKPTSTGGVMLTYRPAR